MRGFQTIKRGVVGLAVYAFLISCGDGSSPTEPDTGAEEQSEGVALFSELNKSLEQVLVLMFSGGGRLEGVQGQLVVTADKLTFEGYSSDGELVMNGELTISLTVPPGITGRVDFSGPSEGWAIVAITIDASTEPVSLAGTITIGEDVYDVAELAAEAEAAE